MCDYSFFVKVMRTLSKWYQASIVLTCLIALVLFVVAGELMLTWPVLFSPFFCSSPRVRVPFSFSFIRFLFHFSLISSSLCFSIAPCLYVSFLYFSVAYRPFLSEIRHCLPVPRLSRFTFLCLFVRSSHLYCRFVWGITELFGCA